MYEDYFGLRQLPFGLNPDPQFLYFSPQHREALAQLLYGLKGDGGFIVLSGEVGTGKTTLLNELKRRVPENINIGWISNPILTPKQVLEACCVSLQIKIRKSASQRQLFAALEEHLLQEFDQGRRCLLLIDEAQDMPLETIEQLRLLTNIESYGHHVMQILLCGQTELGDMLKLHEMRQLSQRIVARFHLQPLPLAAVKPYVQHRLAVVGAGEHIFHSDSYALIAKHSQGIPRLINQICHRSLLLCFSDQRTQVNKTRVKLAIEEIEGISPNTKPLSVAKAFSWILVGMLATLAVGLGFILWERSANSVYAPQTGELAVDSSANEVPRFNFEPAADPYQFAAQALFDNWQLSYRPNDDLDLCAQAAESGLSCMRTDMSAAEIRQINRPALVQINNAWHSLLELRADTASLAHAGAIETNSSFGAEFYGETLLLLRLPPGWEGSIEPGSSGFGVFWLTQQLGKVAASDIQLDSDLSYSPEVSQLVADFQSQQGLPSTGAFDLSTLLSLNQALFPNTPTLSP